MRPMSYSIVALFLLGQTSSALAQQRTCEHTITISPLPGSSLSATVWLSTPNVRGSTNIVRRGLNYQIDSQIRTNSETLRFRQSVRVYFNSSFSSEAVDRMEISVRSINGDATHTEELIIREAQVHVPGPPGSWRVPVSGPSSVPPSLNRQALLLSAQPAGDGLLPFARQFFADGALINANLYEVVYPEDYEEEVDSRSFPQRAVADLLLMGVGDNERTRLIRLAGEFEQRVVDSIRRGTEFGSCNPVERHNPLWNGI